MLPYCADYLFKDPKYKFSVTMNDNNQLSYPDADKWATRGAVNAGLAVFLYLDQLERGNVHPKPLYNHCEQLTSP